MTLTVQPIDTARGVPARLASAAPWILAGVFALSVAGKALAMNDFQAFVYELRFLPTGVRHWLPLLVIGAELTCVALLLSPRTRGIGLGSSLLLLTAFTLFLFWKSRHLPDASCECFGGIIASGSDDWWGILQNLVLMVLAGMGLSLTKDHRNPSSTPAPDPTPSPPPFPVTRGVTLMELLVTIGVVGVLIGILLPVLALARESARSAQCLSNQRQIGLLAVSWASDHMDHLPLDGLVCVAEVDYATGPGQLPRLLRDNQRRKYDYTLNDGSYWGSGNPPTKESPTPFLPALLRRLVDAETGDLINPSMRWTREVESVHRQALLFQCPSARQSHRFNYWLGDGNYSLLYQIENVSDYHDVWTVPFDYATNAGLLGFQHDMPHNPRALRGRLTAVRDPSRTVLTGDGGGYFMSWAPTPAGTSPRVTLADVLARNDEIFEPWWALYPGDGKPIDDRHRGRINVLFTDGHAKSLPATPSALDSAVLVSDE